MVRAERAAALVHGLESQGLGPFGLVQAPVAIGQDYRQATRCSLSRIVLRMASMPEAISSFELNGVLPASSS